MSKKYSCSTQKIHKKCHLSIKKPYSLFVHLTKQWNAFEDKKITQIPLLKISINRLIDNNSNIHLSSASRRLTSNVFQYNASSIQKKYALHKLCGSKPSPANKTPLNSRTTQKMTQQKNTAKTDRIVTNMPCAISASTCNNAPLPTESMTLDKLYPILKNDNLWNISISPVHLKGLDTIAKIFGKSRSTLRTWSKEGAPIIFDGVSYYSEYNLLFAWLLNRYRDQKFIDDTSKVKTSSQRDDS